MSDASLDPVADTAPGRPSTPDRSVAVRDHLANERTLLAWQRTALALVGLGFVVDRFAFEGSQEKAVLGTALGLAMIAGGGLTAVVGVIRFRRVEAQIDADDYQPSILAHLVFAAGIALVAVLLLVYLLLAKP
jgi:putative membrane protein